MRAPFRLPLRVVRAALVRAAALPVITLAPGALHAQGAPHVAATDAAMAHAAPAPAATVARPAVRVVGAYTVANPRGGFPVAFTVADSAGRLVARYRMQGDATDRPMYVDVAGADLVLEAYTADGPLRVILDGQNEATVARAGRLTGRWEYRGTTGVLRGHVQR